MTVAAGHAQKIEVGMCGEMAGDLLATIVLLGLGLDSLSASPVSLLEIKKIIRSIRFSEAQKFAQKILTCKTYEEIHRMTVRTMKERFAELPIWFSAKDNYHKLG
jgi:phosphotransferase system enzyme I (PtsI)